MEEHIFQVFLKSVEFYVSWGLLVGIMQWIILRKHFSKAGWWVLVSCVGWFVAGFISRRFYIWVACGAIYGVITGIAMVRLLRQPVAKA